MADTKKTYSAVPSYEMIPVRIFDEENEKEIVKLFKVYVKGPGCPLPITIEVDSVWEEYQDNYPASETRGDTPREMQKFVNAAHRVTNIARRDLLMTVTEGMSVEIANVLVSPDNEGNSEGVDILIRTKWMDKIASDDEEKPDEEESGPKEETGA